MSVGLRTPVAIVILHFGRPEDTSEAVRSALASTVPTEVIVVDNSATNGLGPGWGDAFADRRVQIVDAHANLGFAAGVNLGLRLALGRSVEHVFLLNNDAVIEPETVEKLISVAEAQPKLGILAPVIYYNDRPDRIWSAGGRRESFFSLIRNLEAMAVQQAIDDVVDVDMVTGCAMLVSRSTLDRVGFFDERYFMYYEDVDFCFRAKKEGIRIATVPAARAYHRVPAIPRPLDPARLYVWFRSKALFYTTSYKRWGRVRVLPRLFLSSLAFGWRCLKSGDTRSLSCYLRATADGWCGARSK